MAPPKIEKISLNEVVNIDELGPEAGPLVAQAFQLIEQKLNEIIDKKEDKP